MLDERLWRKERAAVAARPRRHQGLERPAEHLGIDRRLGPGAAILPCREAVARQQLGEERAERLVIEDAPASPPLYGCRSEEAAVQERDAAEGARGRGASDRSRVERAEEQRAEDTPVVRAAGGHALVEASLEKGTVAVEPSLALQKGEKEQSRRVEQRDLAALGSIDARAR